MHLPWCPPVSELKVYGVTGCFYPDVFHFQEVLQPYTFFVFFSVFTMALSSFVVRGLAWFCLGHVVVQVMLAGDGLNLLYLTSSSFSFPKLLLVLGQVFCYVVHSLPAFCVFPLLVFAVYYYVCLFFPLFLFLLSRSSSFSPGSSPGNQTNLRNGWLAARVAGWMAAWVGRRLGADLPCQVILLGEV